ncbi:MAG: hypothetical protein KDA78_14365, partial [Planctomycetaceae bacterium]|nr:hypothetical protein [Planctomycetaceae bacterium]
NDPALNFLVIFPDHPVQMGETWKQTLEVEVPITDKLKEKVKLLRTYRLKQIENQVAQIEVATSLVTIIRDPAVQTRIMTQTPSGVIEFDLEQGIMLSRTLDVNDQVVGAFGSGTLVHARNHRSEKLLNESETVSENSVSVRE